MTESAPPESPIAHAALRQVSLRLLPLLALGYGCAYMDRVNVGFAALQMNQALHFSGAIYGFGAGIFFVSYAACEVPSNLLLYRFGARRWLARIMFTWGLIAIAMLFVRTPWQFYTARFFLGMAEAGYFPGVLFYLSQWFPSEMRARAIGRFYVSLPISSTLVGLFGGMLLNLDGFLKLAGWQWLFLIEGIPPVLLGFVFLHLLPDSPAEARWLTQDQRHWITAHTCADATSHSHHGVGRALMDVRVWQIATFELLMLFTTYGYLLVLPQLVQASTHASLTRIGLITAGISLLGAPSMLYGGIHSDRSPEYRYRHIAVCCIFEAIAVVICGSSTAPIVVIPALCMVTIAFNLMQGPFWILPTKLFQGRSSAAAIAAINSIGILGGFLGPAYMGVAKDLTGTYQRGLLSLSLPMFLCAGIMMRLHRRSKAADRTIATSVLSEAID